MLQRTTSESGGSGGGGSGPSSKIWRPWKKKQWPKEDPRGWNRTQSDFESHETFNTESNASGTLQPDTPDANYRQLQALIHKMRSAPSGPKEVDAAYKEFIKIKDQCAAHCTALLQGESRTVRTLSHSESFQGRRDSSIDDLRSSPSIGHFDHRSSFSGRSLTEVATNSAATTGAASLSLSQTRGTHVHDVYLAAIREWKNCIEVLVDAFHSSLLETFKSYERDATQEMIDAFFTHKKFRRDSINRMRNASVTRVMSADPQFFPRYEIRFRNYEKAKEELRIIRDLLHAGESGISPSRHVEEVRIAQRGDTILEFANNSPDATGSEPVLRFRVSSHNLAETSPIFARMFSGNAASMVVHENEDITPYLPPPWTPYTCKDGSKARLFRMPQYELNKESSLSILLHAAHLHHEEVPREVTFEQFVAIAECALRYKCTSPLELVVEHRWLPQWMHKGADDMPDGLLVISYAFGLRQLFARTSKSVVLNLVDEKDLYSKPWPPRIRDKIWAVRQAKMAQVNACCISTIQEYIRQPSLPSPDETESPPDLEAQNTTFSPMAPPKDATSLTSSPRCPKGNHACDAINLGWMMLMYNELGMLPQLFRSDVMFHVGETLLPSRSLAQLLEAARKVPSPPTPIHRGGVCDPGPAFRAAVNDIYNSITGLTLYDVSGKSHGWALSKHRVDEPQALPIQGLERMAAPEKNHSVIKEFPDEIRLRILSELDNLDDLYAAAMTSRGFYNTYKEKEVLLMRNILRAGRVRSGSMRPFPLSFTNAEDKLRKEDSDALKESGLGVGTDMLTLRSVDEEVEYSDSDEDDRISIDQTPAPPIEDTSYRRGPPNGNENRRSRRVTPPEEEDEDTDELVNRLRPRTPRAAPPSPPATISQPLNPTPSTRWSPQKPTVELTENVSEVLTREEAERILWPETHVEMTPAALRSPLAGTEGLREKFLGGDLSFAKGPEEKTLIVAGQKQLSRDGRAKGGVGKGNNRPGSSSSEAEQGTGA